MNFWQYGVLILILAFAICFGAWVYPWISREAELFIQHEEM